MSGGIDSPVAAYVMARAGAEVHLLHMDNRPYADDRSIERAKKIAEQLRKVTGQEMPLWSAPHGPTQKKVADTVDHLYQCVMCKHAMQLTAKKMCQRMGFGAIVMGDSLGQVASQTLMNLNSESKGVDFLVLRPLIGYDKEEIMRIAREIGTYDLSNLPATGCTALPKKVVTEADFQLAEKYYADCNMESLTDASAAAATRLS
jgi:thiamine biosynthesis protein ThiI